MSTEIERVVTPTATPQLADVGDRPVARTLAEELKTAGDWRKTSAGAALDLRNVDLSGADLRGVDFTDAVMSGAKLTNANLIGAQFAWAKLQHADFSGATGVVGTQFARADLMGATLPPSVKFGTFDAANDIAQSTGKIFLTMLLVCVYSWLTINSTVDSKLLTDSSTSKLPILNVDIPIVNFYVLVPIALVGVAPARGYSARGPPRGSAISRRSAFWDAHSRGSGSSSDGGLHPRPSPGSGCAICIGTTAGSQRSR
jgi:hypothetical protein